MRFISKLVGDMSSLEFYRIELQIISKEVPYSTRLAPTHLNNSNIVKSHELEATFIGCTDKEDAWKLGLLYLLMVYYIHMSPIPR